MTAYKGINTTLKLGSGAGAPIITQARTHTMRRNNELVDITNKDTLGWRTLLEDAGTKSITITIEGIVDNSTTFETFENHANNSTIATYRFEYADSNIFEGLFQISSYEVTGASSGAQTFTATLESSGQITFTQG
jgi:TP901-1 family phage major tail protein